MPIERPPQGSDHEFADLEAIDRVETGVRALKTLLFYLITQVIELVLVVVVLFDLLIALITGQDPSRGVRRFSQRVIDYWVVIARYVTYLDEEAPFPFRDFPRERAIPAEDWVAASEEEEEEEPEESPQGNR